MGDFLFLFYGDVEGGVGVERGVRLDAWGGDICQCGFEQATGPRHRWPWEWVPCPHRLCISTRGHRLVIKELAGELGRGKRLLTNMHILELQMQ